MCLVISALCFIFTYTNCIFLQAIAAEGKSRGERGGGEEFFTSFDEELDHNLNIVVLTALRALTLLNFFGNEDVDTVYDRKKVNL